MNDLQSRGSERQTVCEVERRERSEKGRREGRGEDEERRL